MVSIVSYFHSLVLTISLARFVIKNEAGEAIFRTVMEVCGGACTGWCCSDAELPLITMDGQVGAFILEIRRGENLGLFGDLGLRRVLFPINIMSS